jgi:hypothetical protein
MARRGPPDGAVCLPPRPESKERIPEGIVLCGEVFEGLHKITDRPGPIVLLWPVDHAKRPALLEPAPAGHLPTQEVRTVGLDAVGPITVAGEIGVDFLRVLMVVGKGGVDLG